MNKPILSTNEESTANNSGANQPAATILLVDDEEMITRLHQRLFEKWGYQTIVCNTVDAALSVIDSNQLIDLVVTDNVMPQMRGTDFAAVVHQKRPNTPIILSTGNNLAVQDENLESLGVIAVVNKPIQVAIFLEVVRKALAHANP